MSTPAIAVAGLRKAFPDKKNGPKVVLDGVDLTVEPGTVFALLGPNGAGKTTAVQILTTYLRADAGTALVDGADVARHPERVRAAIGVTGQFSAVDGLLTGEENLLLMADLAHLPRERGRRAAAELLERFDLGDAAKKVASVYSGGMRRRLDLAMTLVSRPRIIFLDEPTTGLDPRSRRAMWEIIRELVRGGTTVFLTTQYLDEADQLADRVAVLDRGRVAAAGTPAELKRLVPGGRVALQFAARPGLDAAAALLGAPPPADDGLTLRLPHDGGLRSLRALLDRVDDAALDVAAVTVSTADLDDVFFALTGAPARSGADDPDTPDQEMETAR
jgi:ABC-2 type transport system ATP-binding protein